FWATLHDADAGRIRYAVDDEVDEDRLQEWEFVRAIIERQHPGLDGLTTLTSIERNFGLLGWLRLAMEYLGYFGRDSGNATLLSSTEWEETTRPGPVPTGVEPLVLAFAVHLGGAWASVAVGWLEDDDTPTDLVQLASGEERPPIAAFKLVHHQDGNANLARVLLEFWR
ncbi:hypothetical protein NRA59_19095, partial [Acinetobacter baumannii]|nr:hypothetical protein [Acinetobacter baumannii]